MIKRPITAGAVILAVILYISSFFGVSDTVPRTFLKEGTRLLVAGRVQLRESMTYGTRLTLEECTILSVSSENSYETSSKTSIANSNNISLKLSIENSIKLDGLLQVYLKKETEKIHCGSWIVVEGVCNYFEQARNPGQFDSEKYYRARNVLFQLKKAELRYQWRETVSYGGVLARVRERLSDSMEAVLGKEDAAVIAAITLGKREGLTAQVKQLYQEGGISHILAISSLHITLLGMGLYRLLRKLRWPIGGCCVVSGVFLFSFCVMTGMSVSARRACIMYLIWLGRQFFGRTNDRPTGMALASFFILLPSPEYLQDSSFLLSFGCVLSLLAVTPLMKKVLPIPGKMGEALQASAAIQIGTLPIIMTSFYQVTPYAFLVNLVVIPFMEVLMITGLLGSVMGLFSLPLGVLTAAPCHYLLQWFEFLCRMEKKLPGAVIITGCPEDWQIAAYYGILLLLCWYTFRKGADHGRKQRGRLGQAVKQMGIIGMGLTVAISVLSLHISPDLRITFLDVGQGDGILIQSGEFACLIDGGSSSVDKVWQYRMENTLKYYGISRLNAVLLSHGDADHISGVEELLENYDKGYGGVNVGSITVECIMFPDTGYKDEALENLKVLATNLEIPVGTLTAGGSLTTGGNLTAGGTLTMGERLATGGSLTAKGTLAADGSPGSGEWKLTCLYPDEAVATGDSNQDSMVLLLEYGDFTALFTGDLEKEGEENFIEMILEEQNVGKTEMESEMQVDILKVGHHGSKNGTSAELLALLSPKIAVISCGENNSYGHPAQETMERLEQAGAQIFRTDRNGAVIVEMKDGNVKLKTVFSGEKE